MSRGAVGIVLFLVAIVMIGAGSVIRRAHPPAERGQPASLSQLGPTVTSVSGVVLLVVALGLACLQPI